MKYVFLGLAIACEVFGSSMLKMSDQFSKLWPSVFTVIGFALCFFFLSYALRYFPLSIAYAIWAGVGIVATSAISVLVFKQSLDLPAIIGIGFIVVGVIIINLLSKSFGH